MNFARLRRIRGQLAELSDTARAVVAGSVAFALCEVGTRISAPHINGAAIGDMLRRTEPGGLLALYDRVVGGALSRGAVLALGIMPYLSARIFVRIARSLSPALNAKHETDLGRRQLTRATRWLTFGLSLVQSYGFARFALSVPGAVTDPGAAFIAETMLVLTSGALVVMALAEQFGEAFSSAPQPDTAPQMSPSAEVLVGELDAQKPVAALAEAFDAATVVAQDQLAARTRL